MNRLILSLNKTNQSINNEYCCPLHGDSIVVPPKFENSCVQPSNQYIIKWCLDLETFD